MNSTGCHKVLVNIVSGQKAL